MKRISWRGVLGGLAVTAAVGIGAGQASASPVITVEIESLSASGYEPYRIDSEGTPNPDGTFTLEGNGYNPDFNCDWIVTVNPDPSITGTFNLTNLSASTTVFVLNVTLPVPGGIGAPTVMGGYIGSAANGVVYTDLNDGDVTFSSVGSTPVYQARLDNLVTVQGLLLGTFQAFGTPGDDPFGDISQLTWGTPIPSAVGPGFSTNMSVRTTFSLTAGDRVSIPVNFVIEPAPVPEPGSLALIGLSVAALVGLRSRRS